MAATSYQGRLSGISKTETDGDHALRLLGVCVLALSGEGTVQVADGTMYVYDGTTLGHSSSQ